MSSDLQSILQETWFNNYLTVVSTTAIVYDYFLGFSREVEYVWFRSWTWVSAIFVIVRYTGLCYTISAMLYNIPWMASSKNMCDATFFIDAWNFIMFLAAADLVMILRVYAMWNRSKRILIGLLFLYVPQALFSIIYRAIYYKPQYLTATGAQVTDSLTTCIVICNNAMCTQIEALRLYPYIMRLALSVALISLLVIQIAKQSLETYRAIKQWQLNKYIQQFVQDGTLYFLLDVLFSITEILQTTPTPNYYAQEIQSMLCFTLMISAMPRFIISMRELYDHDLRTHRRGIDSAFGVLSQPVATWSTSVVISEIGFADVIAEQDSQSEVVEDDVQMAQLQGDGTCQVMQGGPDNSKAAQLECSARQV